MTREVAIEGLKAFRREFSGYEPNEEMFDMAIKALEQELTTKNNLGVDCISRDDVRDVMQELWGTKGELMDRLMALPSVTPQEPILDKIRAEIAELDLGFIDEDYKAGVAYAVMKFNKIIDKYKAESEVEDGNVD